ncbi:MAG: ABC transporter substrate-binding protein [Planctomycetota bacterium]|nr:ABC transporter substrate-binding protein [Planctomycetota bacterium]
MAPNVACGLALLLALAVFAGRGVALAQNAPKTPPAAGAKKPATAPARIPALTPALKPVKKPAAAPAETPAPAPAPVPANTATGEEAAKAEEPPVDLGPLYEQEPYDLVTLTAANKNKVLKVEPLELPNRRLPKEIRRSRKLKIRLWEDPETLYELRWGAIEKIDLFEQLVLKKAVELMREGKSEEAFDYFAYLKTSDPTLPGLDAALQDYIYREAGRKQSKKQYRGALALLRELYSLNPQHPKVAVALGAATDKLVEQYAAKKDYASARTLVASLAKRFPQQATVLKWTGRLKGEAQGLFETSREAFAAGDFRKADRAGRQIARIWPGLPGVKEHIAAISKRYPRIVVGVSMPIAVGRFDGNSAALTADWATRRCGRLFNRTLTEYEGTGPAGGIYVCPVGDMEIADLERGITLQLKPDIRWFTAVGGAKDSFPPEQAGTLTGADVARRLLAMADPGDPAYSPTWAGLMGSVSVTDVYNLQIDLTRPHVRPNALLQTVLPPYSTGKASPQLLNLCNGPFSVAEQKKDEIVFVANKNYFAAEQGQPREIAERAFESDREMVRALGDGRIKLIDRVNPWDLSKVRSLQDIEVRPYAVPLAHCLIPNVRKPLMSQRTFRRALIYGINRKSILDHLIGGVKMSGSSLLSGPFLRGESYDDPLGYAYDTTIKPRPYEPHLAIALAGVAVDMLAAAKAKKAKKEAVAADAKKDGKKSAEEQPPKKDEKKAKEKSDAKKTIAKLVLAHPPNEVARVACSQIKGQLKLVGIEVTLKELPPGPVERVPEDADLLYAELPIWEPIVAARPLLSDNGPARGASKYMDLALRQLDWATDWPQVSAKLREIHRIAHNDVAVIPLWQLTDHFAHSRSLQGIGERPVMLYQNVEQWRIVVPKKSPAK